LAANGLRNEIELARGDADVASDRAGLGVGKRPFACWLAHYPAGASGAAAGAAPGAAPSLTFRSAEWLWKMRVGANSPNLWPIMSSVIITGMCFWPLYTPNVRPTNCGRMVERRDHILITSLRPELRATSAFLSR